MLPTGQQQGLLTLLLATMYLTASFQSTKHSQAQVLCCLPVTIGKRAATGLPCQSLWLLAWWGQAARCLAACLPHALHLQLHVLVSLGQLLVIHSALPLHGLREGTVCQHPGGEEPCCVPSQGARRRRGMLSAERKTCNPANDKGLPST